ncbi:16S rRNA (guanine(527)-N(7))-methyltransferase RsmG [bacterium]|nr:MAG: 16S rRNA (guanine(527)-N(7))-methyltransferase RsmG [bacterium]
MRPEELLKKGLSDIGFPFSEEQIQAFMTYLAELKKWNRAYNLTALKTDEDIVTKHFLDSVLYFKAVPGSMKTLKLADIGTGAGFPGIPIKILCPEADITLLEPSRKKTAFLRHMLRTLHFKEGITLLEKRIETLGENYKRTFDLIVSRATFTLEDFLEKACPYVKRKGKLVLSKGPKAFDEIDSLNNSQKEHIDRVIRLRLTEHERNLLVLTCSPSRSARP